MGETIAFCTHRHGGIRPGTGSSSEPNRGVPGLEEPRQIARLLLYHLPRPLGEGREHRDVHNKLAGLPTIRPRPDDTTVQQHDGGEPARVLVHLSVAGLVDEVTSVMMALHERVETRQESHDSPIDVCPFEVGEVLSQEIATVTVAVHFDEFVP